MSVGFTPGPWAVGYDAEEVYSVPNYQSVCMVLGTVTEGPNNANLISAAPDLYEGALDTIKVLKLLRVGLLHDSAAIEKIDAHIDELEYVTRKARGDLVDREVRA